MKSLLDDREVTDTIMNRMVAACYDEVPEVVWRQNPAGLEVDWGGGMVMPAMPSYRQCRAVSTR